MRIEMLKQVINGFGYRVIQLQGRASPGEEGLPDLRPTPGILM